MCVGMSVCVPHGALEKARGKFCMTSASNAAALLNPTVFMGPLSNPIIWVGILQCTSVGGQLDSRH